MSYYIISGFPINYQSKNAHENFSLIYKDNQIEFLFDYQIKLLKKLDKALYRWYND